MSAWERVGDTDIGPASVINVWRMAVPGGWLYRVVESDRARDCMGVAFVPASEPSGRSGVLRGYEIQDAEPAPSVEVTEAVLDAACDAYWRAPDDPDMRSAIIAADRARGLRR